MAAIFQVVLTAMTIELLFAADRNRKVQVNVPKATMKQKSVGKKRFVL
jgi:hypothetical protein